MRTSTTNSPVLSVIAVGGVLANLYLWSLSLSNAIASEKGSKDVSWCMLGWLNGSA